MAAETSWHRYETKLRHCHPMYTLAMVFSYMYFIFYHFRFHYAYGLHLSVHTVTHWAGCDKATAGHYSIGGL